MDIPDNSGSVYFHSSLMMIILITTSTTRCISLSSDVQGGAGSRQPESDCLATCHPTLSLPVCSR